MKRFYKKKLKPKSVQKVEVEVDVDEKTALRAFVSPDLYPFLLCCYKEDGKTEAMLNADIKNAQEQYDELIEYSVTELDPVEPEPVI